MRTEKVFPPGSKDADHRVSVRLVHYDASPGGVAHTFDQHTLTLHLSGAARVSQVRNHVSCEGTFTRGDLSLVPAGARVCRRTEAPADVLTVGFSPAFVHDVLEQVTGDGGRASELACVFRFDDPLCRELSLAILHEAETGEAAARLYVESAATVVVLQLARISRRAIRASTRSVLPGPVLKRAKDFMRDEMRTNPSLQQLARVAGMGVHHFSRMFKRSTGLAPHQYVAEIRFAHAKSLLTDQRRTIAEIARDTGFANPSQFSAFFRKRAGLTASEFRLRMWPADCGQASQILTGTAAHP